METWIHNIRSKVEICFQEIGLEILNLDLYVDDIDLFIELYIIDSDTVIKANAISSSKFEDIIWTYRKHEENFEYTILKGALNTVMKRVLRDNKRMLKN